jgi:hypothetical protein
MFMAETVLGLDRASVRLVGDVVIGSTREWDLLSSRETAGNKPLLTGARIESCSALRKRFNARKLASIWFQLKRAWFAKLAFSP